MVAVVLEHWRLPETLQVLFTIAQPLNMRDLLVGFQREAKAFGNRFRPLEEHILGWHAIEACD